MKERRRGVPIGLIGREAVGEEKQRSDLAMQRRYLTDTETLKNFTKRELGILKRSLTP